MKPLGESPAALRVAAATGALLAFLLVAGAPASAAKASKKPAFQMPKIRLTAVSTPVPFATIRASKRAVKLGTVSYLLGDYRQSYDVMVYLTHRGALAWSAPLQGQTATQDAGTIPAAQMQSAANGHLCVIAEKAGTRPTGIAAKGKRYLLFNRFSPDYRAMLVVCPNTVPIKPVRTALVIQGEDKDFSTGSASPGKMGGGSCSSKTLPWQLGAKAFDTAMRGHAKLRKPIALLFSRKDSKECKQLDAEVLSACRVQEILSPAVKVRIDPGAGAAEKAIAARFGVTAYPSFLVIPGNSTQPKWIMPEGGRGAKQSDATMPCHFHDTLDAAIKGKG